MRASMPFKAMQRLARTMSGKTKRDKPWMFRTYAGHSTAKASNELYRQNLAKGQTGLSVAFDLPTQTGYDSDDPLARGEVGKVGVPVSHLGDMRALIAGHPARRDEHLDDHQRHRRVAACRSMWRSPTSRASTGASSPARCRTTSSRNISRAAPMCSRRSPSLRLIKDVIVYAAREIPKWNPTNVCSYHLQEAGATPTQELAFALATAEAVLDEVKNSGEVSPEEFPASCSRRISLLRQCRRALHHRSVQDARLRRSVGRDRREALRRHRPGAPPLPLRRAGEFAGPHRAAAREQRLPHPALHARGDAVEEGARPRRAAPSLERGARPAAALGPAMVAQAPADRGL